MPAEEGLGRDQGVQVTAYPSPEALGLCGQAPALGVGDPETARTELLSADAILFLERVNDVTLLLVDPARDGHDEELQHLGNRRHTGRAEQRLSAVTNVATRRASSVESARRTASIEFLDSTRLLGSATLEHNVAHALDMVGTYLVVLLDLYMPCVLPREMFRRLPYFHRRRPGGAPWPSGGRWPSRPGRSGRVNLYP